MRPLTVAFVGAVAGTWAVERVEVVSGSPLAPASHLEVLEGREASGSVGTRCGSYVESRATSDMSAVSSTMLSFTPGAAWAAWFHAGRAHPDQEVRDVVGARTGRTPSHLRGEFTPRRLWTRVPASRRQASASWARPPRAFRLPDVVRVHPWRRGRLRGARAATPHHRGMDIRRTGGRHAPRSPGRQPALGERAGGPVVLDTTILVLNDLKESIRWWADNR